MTPERVAIARAADHIFISEIRAAGIYDEAGLTPNVLTTVTDSVVDEPSLRRHQQGQRYVLRPLARITQAWQPAEIPETDNPPAVGVQGDARVYGYIAM